ncbi:InlB B-repeat-containing protein [Butyrivibrio fibrisolvens]|uniref:InlB B-repeat-containing protein n=1 Tax=Butyrivibrio fibrisolvens TaxID=831 RepID=UPI00042980D1|nr:InlB B-repeat-containing protein [Butyrivibrio fibrisolvens]
MTKTLRRGLGSRAFALILAAGMTSNSFTIRTHAQDYSDLGISALDNTSSDTNKEGTSTGGDAGNTNVSTGTSGADDSDNTDTNKNGSDNNPNNNNTNNNDSGNGDSDSNLSDSTLSGDGTSSAIGSEGAKDGQSIDAGVDGAYADNTSNADNKQKGSEHYTVTLDANGGTVSTDEIEVLKDSNYKSLPFPTRDNYVFLGWSLVKTDDSDMADYVTGEGPISNDKTEYVTDESYAAIDKTDYITSDSIVTTYKDHTLYAVWAPKEYAVTLNAGSGAVNGVYDSNDNSNNDGNDKSLIIYVNYDREYGSYHKYLIVEEVKDENNADQGSKKTIVREGTPDDYTDIKIYEELPTATLEGYKFLGWSTDENAIYVICTDAEDTVNENSGSDKYIYTTSKVDSIEDLPEAVAKNIVSSEDKITITKDHTLSAVWVKGDFDKDSGTDLDKNAGSGDDKDSTKSLDDDSDAKKGQGSDKDLAKDSDNNASGSSDNNSVKDTEDKEATDKEATDKEAKEKEGSNTENVVTYTPSEEGDSIDLSTSLLGTSGNLSASLMAVPAYTVTFRLQGGSFATTDSVVFTVESGDTIPKPEDPTRTKYDFRGWFTSADGDVEYDFAAPITGDTYIYAQWEARYKAQAPTVSISRSRTDSSTGTDNGSYVGSDAKIALASSSYDAKIYYILNPESDSDVPTASDNLYTDVLTAGKIAGDDGTVTIRAIACKDGYEDSDVSTFVFNVIPESENWGELMLVDRALYTDASEVPDNMWVAGISDRTYMGTSITFSQNEMRVYDGKKLLTMGTDYTVSYKNNTNVGTATITITGKGNFSGSIQKTFAITPRDISDDSFSAADILLQYTGRVQKGTTSLIYNNGSKNITLRAGSDFTYTYPGTDAKGADYANTAFVGAADTDSQYTITLTGKGNYTGSRTVTQTIVSKDKVMMSRVSASVPAVSYSDKDENGEVRPVPVVKDGRKTLTGVYCKPEDYADISEDVAGSVDYIYYYTDNDHAGTGYVVLEGRNGYAGSKTVSFTIKGVALSAVKFSGFVDSAAYDAAMTSSSVTSSAVSTSGNNTGANINASSGAYESLNIYQGTSFTYSGQEQKYENILTYGQELVKGVDYEVSYSGDTTNVGTVTVTYTGIGGFTGSVKKTYKITAYNLTDDSKSADPKVSVSVIDEDGDNTFAYVKGGVTPKPVVRYNGSELKQDKDFTVKYANNTTVNSSKTPTVTITGKGNFTGSINATFTIESQSISAQGLALSASDKVYTSTKGNYVTSFAITDSNDKVLSVNTDYDRNVVYSYTEDVTLYDGTSRRAGDIAASTDIVPAGTIMRITAAGKGLYQGTISGTYRIVSGDVFKASVRVYTQYYTGDEVRPDKSQIEVKLGGVILSAEDYEIVSYENNVSKGTAKLTIKGVGDYGGTKTVSFTIAAKTMNYVIIFNGNGSTGGSVSNQTLATGKSASLSANRYTRKSYVFAGWNTESDGSGTYYQDKQTVTNDGSKAGVNLVLYAQWEPEVYNIVYHLNGGSGNAANTKLSYTAKDPTFTIYAPEREDWETGYQFGGWYLDSAYKTRITEVRSGSYGDIHLYAKWIPYTYTVHFDGNGATSGQVTDEAFSYGVSKALSPNKFGKKGFVFAGWAMSKEDADNGLADFSDKESVTDLVSRRNNVNGQATLYAVWRDTFDIGYDLAGGSFGTLVVPYEYTYGTAVTLPTPTREGYIFGGWYQDDTYKKKITSISKSMSADQYLYAKWTPYTYTISFNGNGNNGGNIRAQKLTYDAAAALNANAFTKKGYVFAGWNTVKDPTANNPGVAYTDKEVVNILPSKNNATITLYAQWQATDYDISYVWNGGSLDESSDDYLKSYKYNHKGGYKLPTPYKEGYTFVGWYSDAGFKTKISSIAQESYGDLTLYAMWDMTYTVVFDSNSQPGDVVTGTMADQKIKYSSSTYLRANSYKSNSFIFMGWAVSSQDAADGIVTYTSGQKIQRPSDDHLTYDATSGSYTMTLYAVWKNIFRITYELNGGEFADPQAIITEYTYSKTASYNLENPVRDGYTFGGWYTDQGLRSRVTNIARGSTGDKTLYAKWNSKNYKVSFIADAPTGKKASGRMGVQTLPFGISRALSKNAYKVTGYSFVGWSLKPADERTESDPVITDAQLVDGKFGADLNGQATDGMTGTSADGHMANGAGMGTGQAAEGLYKAYTDEIKLYAVWERNTYSIIYNNVAGIDNSMNPDTYNVDDTIILAEPESLGDTFLGWYSDKGFRTKVTTIKAGTTGTKTFYAKWATTQYTIRYDLNAGSDDSVILDTSNVGYVKTYNDKADSGYRLATASRLGYTFGGWFKETTCRNAVGPIIESPNVDMTVYAKWTPNTYSIHFDKNDDTATGTMKNMSVKYGTSVKLTSNSFKKNYYSFTGWNTESDGSGISYTNGQIINNLTSEQGEAITLYAQWTPYSYKITYYLNKGTLPEDAPMGYSYGDEFELPTPTRDNYTFLGWYKDKNYTESKKVTSISRATTGNITLYARWKFDVIGEIGVPDEYISLAQFGGYPDDGKGDSTALQDAIDRASSNASNGGINTVYLPAGVYNITDIGNYDHGIYLRSNVNLIMDPNAVLKVSGISDGGYQVLSMRYVNNITISGGKLVGERYIHKGNSGEWGHGIAMQGSSNITISNMSISANWGDGIYLGSQAVRQPDDSQKYFGCTDITISNCEVFDNRRNNISLTDADNITITGCFLYDAHGTAPQCSIYIEPNNDSSDKVCEHILIKNTIMTAYQNKNDDLYMVFMTHYNPYNLSYVTARDVKFIGCELNGFFGNYSGLGMTFEDTDLNGTVVNLKAGQ